MIVMKFGGTSVGSAEAIRRVAGIIRSRLPRNPIVVVSAVAKTTDELVRLQLSAVSVNADDVARRIDDILDRHRQLFLELDFPADDPLFSVLPDAREQLESAAASLRVEGKEARATVDRILSVGEFLSSNLLSSFLNRNGIPAVFADARRILVTDDRFGKARPLLAESEAYARELLLEPAANGRVPILQGFVGHTKEGATTTLGRGGSDYSATLIGALLGAEAVEIWSDVDGIMTADPSMVPDAKRIRSMTFQEAAELAYFGAKVLHPATLLPAVEKGISVWVLNSHRPSESGTEIMKSARKNHESRSLVKSIAYKEGITVITVTSTRMLMAYGFLSSIFDVFNRHRTAVDLVATSEVSVSMTVDDTEHLDVILGELRRFADVEIEQNKSIVSIVGENMKRSPGMPSQIFAELGDIPIHLISLGASEINTTFVIDDEQVPEVVNRLHRKFFGGPLDSQVFVG